MEDYNINFDNLQMVCDEYGKAFAEYLKTLLQRKYGKGYNRIASGDLYRSIRCATEPNSNHSVYKVVLYHRPYLKYVENDTRPHWPPIGDGHKEGILKWVRDKKLPTKESTGNKSLPTEKQMAFLVARKISQEGTKGTPYVEESQDRLYPTYEKLIKEALNKDVAETMLQQRMVISIHVR